MTNSTTPTTVINATFDSVSGIITTNAWIWFRSLEARLMSCPVWARSWKPMCSPRMCSSSCSRQSPLGQPALTEGDIPPQRGERARDHACARDQHRPAPRVTRALDRLIDRTTGEQRHGHLAGRPEESDTDAERQSLPLATDQREQRLPFGPSPLIVLAAVAHVMAEGIRARPPASDGNQPPSSSRTRSFGRPMIAASSVTTTGRCMIILFAQDRRDDLIDRLHVIVGEFQLLEEAVASDEVGRWVLELGDDLTERAFVGRILSVDDRSRSRHPARRQCARHCWRSFNSGCGRW